MNSYISSFRWLFAAGFVILAFEVSYYLIFKPGLGVRSNFVPANVQTRFNVNAERYVIWDKIKTEYDLQPSYVMVGDSSGYYGIIPEIVDGYLDGKTLLNLSCCGNQGWHGYLALLEFALRQNPSLEGIIIHAGYLDVPPSEALWRRGGRRIGPSEGSFFVMGKEMERDLAAVWKFTALPSFERRLSVLHAIFHGRSRAKDDFFTSNWHLIRNLKDQRVRQGHSLEQDFQSVKPYGAGCKMFLHRFWDWSIFADRSYLDKALSELSELAAKHDVTPMIAFQVTPCKNSSDSDALRDELSEIQERYPRLIVLTEVNEYRSRLAFSTGVHVQRGFAQDVSHRLGRALALYQNKGRSALPLPVAQPAEEDPEVDIINAEQLDLKWFVWSNCSPVRDVTDFFQDACSDTSECSVPVNVLAARAGPAQCRYIYRAQFRCGSGPVRVARLESGNEKNGAWDFDCNALGGLWPDRSASYGLDVVEATYGASCGGDRFNAHALVKGRCDGKMQCDYQIDSSELKDSGLDQSCKADLSISYRCGFDAEMQTMLVPGEANGKTARLSC